MTLKTFRISTLVGLAVLGVSAEAGAAPKAERNACAPIGKTATGELVYSLNCQAMPAPPSPPVAAAPAPAEPEVERSGLFGMSYTRKAPSQ